MMNIRSISLAILVAASVSVVGLSAGIDVAQARSELSIGGPTGKTSKTDKTGKSKSKDGPKMGYGLNGVGVGGILNKGWKPGDAVARTAGTKGVKSKTTKDSTKAGKSKGTKTTKGTKATKDAKVTPHPDNQYQPGKKYGYKHGVGVLGSYNPGWQPGQFYK